MCDLPTCEECLSLRDDIFHDLECRWCSGSAICYPIYGEETCEDWNVAYSQCDPLKDSTVAGLSVASILFCVCIILARRWYVKQEEQDELDEAVFQDDTQHIEMKTKALHEEQIKNTDFHALVAGLDSANMKTAASKEPQYGKLQTFDDFDTESALLKDEESSS
jgi:hypothetical protein